MTNATVQLKIAFNKSDSTHAWEYRLIEIILVQFWNVELRALSFEPLGQVWISICFQIENYKSLLVELLIILHY